MPSLASPDSSSLTPRPPPHPHPSAAAISERGKLEQQRAVAVRLLIGFMGAAQGFLYPARDFVDRCAAAYAAGWTAGEVFGRLQDEEFVQASAGASRRAGVGMPA